MKYIVMFFLLFLTLFINAQDNRKLSIEMGYDFSGFQMNQLNQSINYYLSNTENVTFEEVKPLKNGNQFRLSFYYNPIRLFDIGVYGSYQYGKINEQPLFVVFDEYNMPVKSCPGFYELRTKSINTGITTVWYISHLLNFEEKENLLNHLHLGLELNFGVGFSKLISNMEAAEAITAMSEYHNYSSQDFQGEVGVKIEYDFLKSPLISIIGLRMGYQYFRTRAVKDRFRNNWIIDDNNPIYLDFSGIYFGAFIKFGK